MSLAKPLPSLSKCGAAHALEDRVAGSIWQSPNAWIRSCAVIRPGGPFAPAPGQPHARVFLVVLDVDDTVAVAVVGAARAAVGALGVGQLARVQVDLIAQPALAPVDAVVEDRDHRVRAPARRLPGAGRVETRDLRLARVRTGGVDRVRRQLGGEAEEVEALGVEVRGAAARAAAGCPARPGRSSGRSGCLRAARFRLRTADRFRASRGSRSPRSSPRRRWRDRTAGRAPPWAARRAASATAPLASSPFASHRGGTQRL